MTLNGESSEMIAALQAAGCAFFTAGEDGVVSACDQPLLLGWLGNRAADARVWSYLCAEDAALAGAFEVAWSAVFENMLPLELTLDQLPTKVKSGARMLKLTYDAVLAGEGVDHLLVVVRDATAEHERDMAEATQRELSHLMRRLVKDTASVEEFFDDGFALVESIERSATAGDLVLLRRSLHTLKGNSGFFGLSRFASLLHEVETQIAEADATEAQAPIPGLVAAWEEIAIAVSPFLGSRCDAIDLSTGELERLIRAANDVAPAEMVERLTALRQESVERRLGRLAQQARSLAVDLGKELDVKVATTGERWEREVFGAFWASVIHVLRNAVDHGVEPREARVSAGKAPRGTLTLRVRETAFVRVFEIEDDGGGIDWAKLRDRATAKGLTNLSDTDLLFVDGLSTRETVTELSGRGVGLAATRAACMDLGGNVIVESTRGRGTCFRFTFPREAVARDRAA